MFSAEDDEPGTVRCELCDGYGLPIDRTDAASVESGEVEFFTLKDGEDVGVCYDCLCSIVEHEFWVQSIGPRE